MPNTFFLLAVMTFACALHSASAQAANRFAAVTIHNPQPVALPFEFRTEGGQCALVVLRPGEGRTFYHQYSHLDENRSPAFFIRFDQDLGSGTFISEGEVQRNAVPDRSCPGAIYHFYFDGPSHQFVNLTKRN